MSAEDELIRVKADNERYHQLINDCQVIIGNLEIKIARLERELQEARKGVAA